MSRQFGVAAAALLLFAGAFGAAAQSAAETQLGYKELFSRAQENSAALGRREAARRGAEASVRKAEAGRFPSLSGRVSSSYLANPADAVEVPRGGLSEGLVETPGPAPPIVIPREDLTFIEAGEAAEYAGSLTLRQPLFTWGRIAHSVELARLQLRVASMRSAAARDSLALTVAGDLYALRQTEKLLALVDQQKAAADTLLSIVKRSAEQGAASRLQVIDQRSSIVELDRRRARIVKEQSRILSELESLTGIEELSAAAVTYAQLADRPSLLPQPEADELARQVLERNRDLAMLAEQREARRLEQEIAEAGKPFRPDVAAIAELRGTTSRVPFLQEEWSDKGNWQARIGVVVEGSLFDGGAGRAEAGAKSAEIAEARFQRLDAIQRIQREIGAGIARLRSLSDELDLQAERLALYEERLSIVRSQEASGAATERELLRERLAVLRAEAEREQLELAYLKQYFQALSFLPVDAWPDGVLPE